MSTFTPTAVPAEPAAPPVLSILCISRNQDENLRRCLAAIAASPLLPTLQVIIVDLASSDDTRLVLDEHTFTGLRLPKNFGWTKAANIGLRSTTADKILFLDPTVVLESGALELLIAAVAEENHIAAAVPTLLLPEGSAAATLQPLPTKGNLYPAAVAPTNLSVDEPVEFPGRLAVCIRKSFLKGMNFLDEHYGETWADAELAMQIKRAGRQILRLAAAKGTLHPEQPKRIDPELLAIDQATGAGVFVGKHFGGGFGFRMGGALSSLATGQLGKFSKLASSTKIDGSQE